MRRSPIIVGWPTAEEAQNDHEMDEALLDEKAVPKYRQIVDEVTKASQESDLFAI